MTFRSTFALTVHLLIVSLCFSSQASANWKLREFLILYSTGWPAEQVTNRLTEASLRHIAAAHYNTVMCETSEVELVANAGLRCLAMGRSQGAPDWIGEAVSPRDAHKLATNPAVWGYYVMDEPDNRNRKRGSEFSQLAEKIREYRAADPDHVAWINMSSALGSFLTDYMDVVKPDFLSWDLYRWWAKESDWWRGLEGHRDAALKARVPMIMWLESNSDEKRFNGHLAPLEGNATKIRWCVYTSLAYGSKGVQWFLGTMDEDVAALNAELTSLGPTLIGLESKHVYHTSAVPLEGQRLPESSWYFTAAPDLLIGEFVNHDEPNSTYFLISNKSIDEARDAIFEFRQRAVSVVEEINKQSVGHTALPVERPVGSAQVRLHLAAGDGRLIRVETR